MSNSIDYGGMMQRALRGLVREILERVAEEGLPGEHHFFITFDTTHPGVDMPPWLKERHPENMTIVMQHWFEDLAVMSDRFMITLSFNDAPQSLVIPFGSIQTFVDPSVEFGLKFEPRDEQQDALRSAFDEREDPVEEPEEEGEEHQDAEVVSLDQFRKH